MLLYQRIFFLLAGEMPQELAGEIPIFAGRPPASVPHEDLSAPLCPWHGPCEEPVSSVVTIVIP